MEQRRDTMGLTSEEGHPDESLGNALAVAQGPGRSGQPQSRGGDTGQMLPWWALRQAAGENGARDEQVHSAAM